MKLTLIALVCAFAPAALACPNLIGTWSCSDAGKSPENMTVTQQVIPGGAMYTITSANGASQQLQADGVAHFSNDSDGNIVTTTVTCQGDVAIDGVETLKTVNNAYSADGSFTFTLPDANTLNGASTAVFHQPGKPDQVESTSSACKRQ